jgi:hypothetical protein
MARVIDGKRWIISGKIGICLAMGCMGKRRNAVGLIAQKAHPFGRQK